MAIIKIDTIFRSSIVRNIPSLIIHVVWCEVQVYIDDVFYWNRKIFWNDHQNCRARIESANMDGSGKQVVVELDEDYEKCQNSCREGECLERFTNQMELNYTSNELYWVDGNQDKLESVGIDGSNYRAVNNISYGFGLGLDVNDVYTTSWIKTFQGYSLWKWHNSPESAFKPLRNDITGKPMDVAVVRRDKRPSGNCQHSQCLIVRIFARSSVL